MIRTRGGARGRPRLDPNDDTVTLKVRMPADFKATLQQTAAERGFDTSELVRSVLESWLDQTDNGGN